MDLNTFVNADEGPLCEIVFATYGRYKQVKN